MTRWSFDFRLALLPAALVLAAPSARAADAPAAPIKALLITGGCCHDYTKQKSILSKGISARAPVEWTIVQEGGNTTDTKIAVYENDDWAKGYDVIVHNECFAGVTDPAWTARILKPHRAGVPGVVIHCAMHCYRDKTDEWFRFLGVTSHGHGANYPFEVKNLAPAHPIMEGFGASWQTPKGELYLISKLWDTATPLAHAFSRDSKKDEVCVWTNQYAGSTRVFGTTLGHHNEEMLDPVYLNLLTRGLLWSVNKLDAAHLKPAPQASRPALVPENLALGKPATASASQGAERAAPFGNDGDPETRWCAPDNEAGYSWRVDLGKPEALTGCRITWEHDARYRYKVEGSADGKTWTMLSDQTASDETDRDREQKFDAKNIRYVRLSITGTEPGHWASFYEFQALGTKLVAAAAGAAPIEDKPKSIGAQGVLAGVKAPPGFDVTLFAAPPDVSYPTCLAAAPTGEVYVGIDQNGSLDNKANRGRIVRCIDRDGDGKADSFNVFATMDSPRGVIVDGRTVYVLHPPDLTAYHDDDGDGTADRSETLVKGIGFDLKFRGADHTTNGIRMGIDGYIYVAVGDYGFLKAVGKDGTARQMRGGGVARVRADGSGLEFVSRGQRNIYDVAIDPYMNLFTRDNTNDGGGWDVRLSHIVPTGQYGYPSLFVNFPGEILPPLADYGGGSPCGSLYLQEPGLPPEFGDTLYTCEWGRGGVFRHPLEPIGAGFKAGQAPFIELPRPTDMDVDGRSQIYISTWKDGGFTYSKPDVGYVIRARYKGSEAPPPFPDLRAATGPDLLKYLASDSQVKRLATQREILRRGDKAGLASGLEALARSKGSLAARVAALFTLEQLRGAKSIETLASLAKDDDLREFALKALSDRKEDAEQIPAGPFVAGLTDANPRVRLAAAIGLGKLGKHEGETGLLKLTADPDPIVAHVAIKALVALGATDAALKGLDPATPTLIAGSGRVLQALHDSKTVDGLIARLKASSDPAVKRVALSALCRLYFKEAEYTGDWWGTRPDTSGPYYKTVKWEETAKIGQVLRSALAQADAETLGWLLPELIKHKIDFEETAGLMVKLAEKDAALRATAVKLLANRPSLTPEALAFLGGVASAPSADPALRALALRGLSRQNETGALDAIVKGLALVAGQEKPQADLQGAWNDFLREPNRQAKHAQRFATLAQGSNTAEGVVAYAVLIQLDNAPKVPAAAKATAHRALEAAWKAPETAARLLRAIGLTRSESYLVPVQGHRKDANPEVRAAAEFAARRLDLDRAANRGDTVAKMPLEKVVAHVLKDKGELELGERLFQKQGCIACHTISKGEALKGPFLGDITNRYSRAELAESILKPSSKIAQGFETQKFATTDGQVVEGFVVRESGDEVEIRNAAGVATVIPKKEIEERGKSELSIMPQNIADTLTPHDLASIMAFLESLRGK